jgi:hypothetical protein
MRRRIMAALMTIACGTTFAGDLLACGEKYIMPTRPTRFARPPAAGHDEAILIYANPGSDLSRTLTKLSVAKALQTAGYRPTLTTDPMQFAAALNAGSWDLVVVDFADVRVADGARPNRRVDAVVPVSYSLRGDQFTQARRQYPEILKEPKSTRAFLEVIDAALEKQRKTQTAEPRR